MSGMAGRGGGGADDKFVTLIVASYHTKRFLADILPDTIFTTGITKKTTTSSYYISSPSRGVFALSRLSRNLMLAVARENSRGVTRKSVTHAWYKVLTGGMRSEGSTRVFAIHLWSDLGRKRRGVCGRSSCVYKQPKNHLMRESFVSWLL